MRGALIRAFSLLVIAIGTAGCQSPGAVGSLQPTPYTANMIGASLGTAPSSSPLPAGNPNAAPPAGFISFCLRFRDQCTPQPGTAPVVVETAQVWQTLVRVNSTINATIAPEDDIEHYGRAEYWTIPSDGLGDCDDYALTKRQALIAAGFPENALRVAVVRTWDDDRHAVLTVSTDKGDFVLDNLRADIVPWSDTDYTWVERQSADNPWTWVALQSDGGSLQLASAKTPTPATPTAMIDTDHEQPKEAFQEVASLVVPQDVAQAFSGTVSTTAQ